MRRSKIAAIPLLLTLAGLATACTNPTVDPASKFNVEGQALDADGQPLANAEVRIVRFFDDLKLLTPSVDDLFTCNSADCGYADLDLEIGLVQKTTSDANGIFEAEFYGEDICAKGGVTDAQGKCEVSNLVIVVLDPSDPLKKTGVFTYDYLFQQADKTWNAGEMQLWKAEASADISSVPGLIVFSWNKIARPSSSQVNNFYRVDIGGMNSPHYIVRCKEGVDMTAGGCELSGNKLQIYVSAISVYTYYSDAGNVNAYIRGAGADYLYQAKFTVPTITLPSNRNSAGIAGVWATTPTQNQDLLGTAATDNNPRTREKITLSRSKEIYVKLSGTRISDAGLLGSLVNDAYRGCVVAEFSTNDHATVDDAKNNASGWDRKGKFCGGNGADRELGAILSFQTNQIAAWMRFRAEPDGGGDPYFMEIGEVAVYEAN